MHQKWHQAYEEATHVPLTISNPMLFKEPRDAQMLTSHVDLIPTLLGLADIDADAAQKEVSKSHNEARLRPEFEMYNLSADQLEEDNLADESNSSRADKVIADQLGNLLKEQREAKRLYPKSLPAYIYDTIQ